MKRFEQLVKFTITKALIGLISSLAFDHYNLDFLLRKRLKFGEVLYLA